MSIVSSSQNAESWMSRLTASRRVSLRLPVTGPAAFSDQTLQARAQSQGIPSGPERQAWIAQVQSAAQNQQAAVLYGERVAATIALQRLLQRGLSGSAGAPETFRNRLVQGSREQLWRGVRVAGPVIDDAAGGLTLGLGTFTSYIVWMWQFVKGLKYKTPEAEPKKLTTLLTPPPMTFQVSSKDVAKLLNRLLKWLVDGVGFVYQNLQVGLVLGLFFFVMIMFSFLYFLLTDPLESLMNPTIRDFAASVGWAFLQP